MRDTVVFLILSISFSGSTAFQRIAAADGKVFFADNTGVRTWSASVDYCKEHGMELAKITSTPQWDALTAAKNTDGFRGWFWTAARDIVPLENFKWNGVEDISPCPTCYTSSNGPSECLYFESSAGPPMLRNYPCNTSQGTICETKASKM